MIFGLLANLRREGAPAAIESAIKWASDRGHDLVLCDDIIGMHPNYAHFAPRDELASHVDVLISMGGDGTILSAARSTHGEGTPILGVNLGHLGFLCQLQPARLESALDDIVAGRYKIEDRILLKAEIEGHAPLPNPYALNDIVLDHGGTTRVLEIDLKINGEQIVRYSADGLIIATPTGSTAYNLAVGGPIVYPSIDAIICSPIAAFSLTTRPMIVSGKDKLELTIHTPGRKAQLTLDGQVDIEIAEADKVLVSKAEEKARFILFPENTYYKLLRNKLHWGVSLKGM